MTSTTVRPNVDQSILSRIESERVYHDDAYTKWALPLHVTFDLATSKARRPCNLTWAYFDAVLDHFHGDLTGLRFLVVGCGEGITALNFAKCGAEVDAFDVSKVAIAHCKKRAEVNGIGAVNFFTSSCEELQLPAEQYDAIVGEMVLHHVDIPIAVEQFHRFLKPGGLGVFMEWKTYALIDRIRSVRLLKRVFPPGGVQGYATERERKLSHNDFSAIRRRFPNMRLDYRYCMRGKLDYFSVSLGDRIEKLDYLILRALPWLKPFTDGVIIRFTKDRSPAMGHEI